MGKRVVAMRAYRVQTTFTELAPARQLYEGIRGGGAYSCELARVTDSTVFPGGFVEQLPDGRFSMGWRRPTVSYVVRAW